MFSNLTICRKISQFLVTPHDDLLWRESIKAARTLRNFSRQFESCVSEISRFHIYYDDLDVVSILTRHPNGIFQLHLEDCRCKGEIKDSHSPVVAPGETECLLLSSPIASLILDKCTISCSKTLQNSVITLKHCQINLHNIQNLVLKEVHVKAPRGTKKVLNLTDCINLEHLGIIRTQGIAVVLPNRSIKSMEIDRLSDGNPNMEELEFITGSNTEVGILKLKHFARNQMDENSLISDVENKSCKLWPRLLQAEEIKSIELEDIQCPDLNLNIPRSATKIRLNRVNLNSLKSAHGQLLKDISMICVTSQVDPIFMECKPISLHLVDVNIVPYLIMISDELIDLRLMFITNEMLDLDFRNLASLKRLAIIGCIFRNLHIPTDCCNDYNILGDL